MSEQLLGPTGKRLKYITWHQHHMYMAMALENQSKKNEENEKSGCLIVDEEHYIIATGFLKDPTNHDQHSIAIAINHKNIKDVKNCILYTTKFPKCASCIDLIIKEKLSKIYYLDDISPCHTEIFERNGISCEKYIKTEQISIKIQNVL